MERIEADLVVLGTGVAGLTAAIGGGIPRVHLLSKGELESGSSPWAQGGVAAALGADDSPALHAADTLAAGAGLVDAEVADLVVRDGARAIHRLLAIGAELDRGDDGELALGREAAHSRRRIVHARGDATGAELVRALGERAVRTAGVVLFERAVALRLWLENGRVAGVVARHADGRTVLHVAPRVVLATGGLGRLYVHTTNPAEVTGDGLLLAAEAGARLADLEFVQFHPTALALDCDPLPLLTEALRGEGAILVDRRGERFMATEHEAGELAPRDVVARAIWRRLEAGEQVFLDARGAIGERFPERFPAVFAVCRRAGLDPRVEPLPVVPAAHYLMGGVAVDRWGRSSVEGLWACGEIATTGVHGANRLASNSLLEALVFGARVAESTAAAAAIPRPRTAPAPVSWRPSDREATAAVRRLAWRELGLVRHGAGLAAARERLAGLWRSLPAGAGETRNLVAAASLVAAAAERREESRGAHFRTDFPRTDARWRRRQTLTAEVGERELAIRFEAPREAVPA